MGSVYDGPERRRVIRVKVDFFVMYKVDKPIEVGMWVGGREVAARMSDLSVNGMAILTNYKIPEPTILLMTFIFVNLSARDERRVRLMEITGRVMYNNELEKDEYRLGIHFTRLSEEDKVAIDDLVKKTTNR